MREILFRAWNISENRYVYLKNGWYDRAFMGANGYYQTVQLTVLLKSDKVICEQYTGLKDENGTKIFEGDIIILRHNKHYWKFECKDIKGMSLYFIEIANNLTTDEDDCYTYEENTNRAGRRKEICCTDSKSIEIIGNIHEGEK